MPSFDYQPEQVEIDFDVYCGTCGHGLCGQSFTSERKGRFRVDVEACSKCLEAEFDRGVNSVDA